MFSSTVPDAAGLVGRDPERLSLAERQWLAGKYIALEIYSPTTLPLRRIEGVGNTPAECLELVARRGLDPTRFEIVLMNAPYER